MLHGSIIWKIQEYHKSIKIFSLKSVPKKKTCFVIFNKIHNGNKITEFDEKKKEEITGYCLVFKLENI